MAINAQETCSGNLYIAYIHFTYIRDTVHSLHGIYNAQHSRANLESDAQAVVRW